MYIYHPHVEKISIYTIARIVACSYNCWRWMVWLDNRICWRNMMIVDLDTNIWIYCEFHYFYKVLRWIWTAYIFFSSKIFVKPSLGNQWMLSVNIFISKGWFEEITILSNQKCFEEWTYFISLDIWFPIMCSSSNYFLYSSFYLINKASNNIEDFYIHTLFWKDTNNVMFLR
jgi:hypothetical protein